MSSLVRQLKLHELLAKARPTLLGDSSHRNSYGKALTDHRVPLIIAFFTGLFDGMEYSILSDYSKDKMIFHKGGVMYMEHDNKYDRLWCCWEDYWSILEKDMGLGYDETQAVVKYMVERHFKQGVGTPGMIFQMRKLGVVRHLDQGIGIPHNDAIITPKWVRKHLKWGIGKPGLIYRTNSSEVEKHLEKLYP